MDAGDEYVNDQRGYKIEVSPDPTKRHAFDPQAEMFHEEEIDGYVKDNGQSGTECEGQSYGLTAEVNPKRVKNRQGQEVRDCV